MSFEDELKNAERYRRNQQVMLEFQKKMSAEQEKRKAEEILKQATEISSEKIEPFLQIVNKVIAEDKGKIKTPLLAIKSELPSTSLEWGAVYNKPYVIVNEIKIEIDVPHRQVGWDRDPKNRLDIDDLLYDARMQDLLIKIIGDMTNYRSTKITSDSGQ